MKSFTEDWLAYTPSPPYIYGNVEFPDGADPAAVLELSLDDVPIIFFTLRGGGTYDAFLVIAAVSTLGGALCFFATGRFHEREPAASPQLP